MNPDTEQFPAATPPGGFEERLLSTILADYDELTAATIGRDRRRHRVSRRVQFGVGVSVLAAVVSAAVVIVSSRGSSRGAGTVAAVRAQNTADIVDRVRADLARLAAAGDRRVLERSSTLTAAGGPRVRNVDWAYIDPRTKVAYQRSVDRSADGSVLSINRLVTTPVGDAFHTEVTFVDPSRRAYDIVADAPPAGTVRAARSETALGIRSSAEQIDRALRSRRVTRRGTSTVDGQPTIELSVAPPANLVRAGLPARTTITLYVNTRSDQPVQEVEVVPHAHDSPGGTSVSRWLPATRRTVALAKVRIPAGYRRTAGPVKDFWTDARPLFFIGY